MTLCTYVKVYWFKQLILCLFTFTLTETLDDITMRKNSRKKSWFVSKWESRGHWRPPWDQQKQKRDYGDNPSEQLTVVLKGERRKVWCASRAMSMEPAAHLKVTIVQNGYPDPNGVCPGLVARGNAPVLSCQRRTLHAGVQSQKLLRCWSSSNADRSRNYHGNGEISREVRTRGRSTHDIL